MKFSLSVQNSRFSLIHFISRYSSSFLLILIIIMMFHLFFLFFTLSFFFSNISCDSPPNYPVWPPFFSINFLTFPENSASPPSQGEMYYDYLNQKALSIFHSAGSYECTHFYSTNHSCQLIFNSVGLWANLPEESPPKCYLDMPGLGASPPNWAKLSKIQYNQTIFIDNYDSYQWIFSQNNFTQISEKIQFKKKILNEENKKNKISSISSAFVSMMNRYEMNENIDSSLLLDSDHEYHEYYETSLSEPQSRVPLIFTFKQISAQSMHFIPSSINYQEPLPSLFQLPDYCKKEKN